MPLEGVRVVDLTMVWAGPFGTRLLGDYGAEVIKVEAPRQWDLMRSLGFQPRDLERWYNKAAYFNHNNRNKLSLTLDLRSPRGRDLLLRLCAISDVLVENFRADVMDSLGLGVEAVLQANPRLLYVSMPGHGKSGPERDYVAFGTNVEQLAGIVSLSGYEDGEPMKTGFSYGDPMAGTALVGAVASGLWRREQTGQGGYIELAQRENLTMFVGGELVAYSMSGELAVPMGNHHPTLAPHNRYRCAGEDSWIVIACEDDAQFAALCAVVGAPELATEPRFATNSARKTNEDDLDAIIQAWTARWGHYEAMHLLQACGVPAGAALSVPELVADPHLRARGAWVEHTHPDAGTWEMEAPPWRLPRTPAHIRLPAPGFGQHNHYVLRGLLGLSEAEVQSLYDEGLTGDIPDQGLHV